ncbi:hypothetical protein FSARC_11676 [Fusarium sarcochroum]|uniref:Rhamnogalacturonase A/B/Epimerase-like pectate lyase domain-containing protein n=1 Tax=Fusarium sarcochroum TaxID=1208366 RepID=A0A8H4X066_9HYPO|nr:hypothetical protein FSARC_11676 [Fusarium sarcochroum]
MPLPRQCFSRWVILSIVGCFLVITVTCTTYFTLAKKRHHDFDWTTIASPKGDKLPDFSFCGYHNSAIILPTVTTPNVTVSLANSSSEDVRPAIQKAIDSMASSGGGLVILPAGKWPITAGITIRSNVVVAGSGANETILVLKERPSKPVFTLGTSNNDTKPSYGFRSNITNSYVPVGSSSVVVVNSTGFLEDQLVYISRNATESWIEANGMSNLVRDGASQTWIPENKRILSPNQISSIYGTNITLKIPLTDNLDSDYVQPELLVYIPPPVSNETGIQDLQIQVSGSCSGAPLSDSTCNYAAVYFPPWTVDSWASGLTLRGFNKFFEVSQDASRITIQNNIMDRDKDVEGSALPFDILIQGSQVLVQDCEQVGSPKARCFSVATGSLAPGPNAVLRHKTKSEVQTIYPHQRWAQGLLVEQTSVSTLFVNRGIKGSGHGWSINGGVGWNIDGKVDFESPPLGINWCIGCGGKGNDPTGNATMIHSGKQVKPESLFMAQLQERGVYRYTESDDDE